MKKSFLVTVTVDSEKGTRPVVKLVGGDTLFVYVAEGQTVRWKTEGPRERALVPLALKLYEGLKDSPCGMPGLCTGPHKRPVNMRTCPGCWALYNANRALKRAGIEVKA